MPVRTRTPDIETWHGRFGHGATHRAVVEAARNRTLHGMSLDASVDPAVCEHCIQGKQTHASIPKMRESPRATRRLERVSIDLAGQDGVVSRSGRVYKMHIVDD
ncbi:hypothetical protein PENSPDRAFT_595760, partial [Peniophora sp. CONT]